MATAEHPELILLENHICIVALQPGLQRRRRLWVTWGKGFLMQQHSYQVRITHKAVGGFNKRYDWFFMG